MEEVVQAVTVVCAVAPVVTVVVVAVVELSALVLFMGVASGVDALAAMAT